MTIVKNVERAAFSSRKRGAMPTRLNEETYACVLMLKEKISTELMGSFSNGRTRLLPSFRRHLAWREPRSPANSGRENQSGRKTGSIELMNNSVADRLFDD